MSVINTTNNNLNTAPDPWPDKVKLRNAKIATAVLVISSFVVPFYWVLHPVAGYLIGLRYLVFPVLTITAYRAFGGYMILAGNKTIRRFPVLMALILPAAFLGLEAYARFALLTQVPLIIPTILLSLLVGLAIAYKNKHLEEGMSKPAKYFTIVFLAVAVAYGLALNLNASGILLQSKGCNAVVAGKYSEISHGRGNKRIYTYYLILKPWKYSNFSNNVITTKIWYDETLPGDSLQVDVYFGLLNVPYYQLRQTAYRWPSSLPI